MTIQDDFRHCLRDPIPEIWDAARYLDAAVSAHLQGRRDIAEELIRLADNRIIWDWTDSVWGKNSPYVRLRKPNNELPVLAKDQRIKVRMPTAAEKQIIHERDGYNCRFCGIPVIRREIREKIRAVYPSVLPWGSTNETQHAAFQAMWAQYDHVLPHARGGDNNINNIVLTCSACNFGRMSNTVDEVGLYDPRNREPIRSSWDGLERFI